jgi:hypothetical protein
MCIECMNVRMHALFVTREAIPSTDEAWTKGSKWHMNESVPWASIRSDFFHNDDE